MFRIRELWEDVLSAAMPTDDAMCRCLTKRIQVSLNRRSYNMEVLRMKEENVVLEKSKCFAVSIVQICQYLIQSKHEYILSKQLLRSGTSIGANITEAQCAQSRNDFYAKMYIAYKEAAETEYWLELLNKSNYISNTSFLVLRKTIRDLVSLLAKITKSSKTCRMPLGNQNLDC